MDNLRGSSTKVFLAIGEKIGSRHYTNMGIISIVEQLSEQKHSMGHARFSSKYHSNDYLVCLRILKEKGWARILGFVHRVKALGKNGKTWMDRNAMKA